MSAETDTFPYENLVLEGGGVKGIAYCGAIDVLSEHGLLQKFKRFAGSSVGSMVAGLLACRADPQFIAKSLDDLNPKKFKDDTWFIFRDIYRLLYKFGFHRGNSLYRYYGRLLEQVTGKIEITFQEVYDMYGTELIIPVTTIYKDGGETIYMRKETHPDTPIRLAVRMSSSFPIFFESVEFDGTYTTDGGFLNNYPINVFDDVCPKEKTLGLKLIASGELKPKHECPTNVKEFISGALDALYNQAEKIHVKKSDWKRTVKINTGDISSMNMDISQEQKDFLYNSGKTSMEKKLEDLSLI